MPLSEGLPFPHRSGLKDQACFRSCWWRISLQTQRASRSYCWAGVRHIPDQHKALASWVVVLAVAVARQRGRTVVLQQMKEEGASSFLPVEEALACPYHRKEGPLYCQGEALAPASPCPSPCPCPCLSPCLHLHTHWEEEAWSQTEKGEEGGRHPFPWKVRQG